MLKKPLPKPSPGELELLHLLWRLKSGTVRQVHEEAQKSQESPKSLNTTLKLIQIMEEKGLVARDGESRPQYFRAVLSQEEAQRGFVQDVVERGFYGKTAQMVLCALQASEITPDEITELRALLTAREQGEAND